MEQMNKIRIIKETNLLNIRLHFGHTEL